MSSSLWEKCLSHLEGELSVQQLNTWLRPLQAVQTHNSLQLLAPNPYVQAWVKEQLETTLNELASHLSRGAIEKVSIDVGTKQVEPKTNAPKSASIRTNAKAQAEPAVGSPMNPLFTFESFVEGKSNQIA